MQKRQIETGGTTKTVGNAKSKLQAVNAFNSLKGKNGNPTTSPGQTKGKEQILDAVNEQEELGDENSQ
jgi:hypothetical protein